MPKPRKLNPASANIAPPKLALATINNGQVDQDLWFCNGADGGDTNWAFGLMKGGTPYPRLANSSNGGGRNSISRWGIIGLCEI